jgi:hypothetical protein
MTAHAAVPPASAWEELAAFWWRRLPAWLRPWSLVAAMAASDGTFLRRWPRAGALVPPAAVLAGVVLGALHPGPLFTDSVVVLAGLALLSGFGAATGGWAWLGFTTADLVAADRSTLPVGQFTTDPLPVAAARGWLPIALAYLLLAVLLVSIPLIAASTRFTARLALRSAPSLVAPLGDGARVAVQGLATMAWAYAAAFLIRPVWSYSGRSPNQQDIAPLQDGALWWGLLAALACGARLWLERRAGLPPLLPPRPAQPRFTQSPRFRAVWQVGLLSWLLSGLAGNVVEFLALAAGLAGIVALRLVVVPRWRGYVAVVTRLPVAARVAVSLAFSYLSAKLVVEPLAETGESSFISLVVVVLLSLLVGALLLPGRRPT